MTLSETFDILTYKGVEKSIQRLFFHYASEDGKGHILFNFFGHDGDFVDYESLSLHRFKQASFGISSLNISENTRMVFVSDSYASLIYFANLYKDRIAFEEAGFLLIGAKFDRELVKNALSNIPRKSKVNTVFSSTILGRIMDCQIENIIQNRDCSFSLSGHRVFLKDNTKGREHNLLIEKFGLWTYCKAMGMNQFVKTYKPKNSGIESFWQLNQRYGHNTN